MTIRIAFSEVPKGLMATMKNTETYLNDLAFEKKLPEFKLLELIRLRVSHLNGCAWCIDMHFKEALAAGENIQRLYSISDWKDTSYYTEEEQACLAWAEYITLPSEQQHDAQNLFEDLLHFYDKEKVANLTLMISQINTWNRLMKSFGIEAVE
ncbi:MAG: carboxymuconolactone decarboxylase family protein [Colwellia sp.]|nr:carboxymuconolactone decarboxylase family protein [Colwellia sp.]